jgi:hypothetical protein
MFFLTKKEREGMLAARGAGGGSPRSTPERGSDLVIDFQAYQRKRFEGIHYQGSLTQEVIQSAISVLKVASGAGQTRARVQLLHLSTDYTYSRRDPPDEGAFVVHDAHTLKPHVGCRTRIHLAARAREFVDWLIGEQKVQVVLATWTTRDGGSVIGEPTFANFMHVIAVFVHEKISPSIWNAPFVKRSGDVTAWNEKCLAAIRIGVAHFAVCVLYHKSDYGKDKDGDLVCVKPVYHLTMEPLKEDPQWKLDGTLCGSLVQWCTKIGYKWTLGISINHSNWAYFVVILDPINEFF